MFKYCYTGRKAKIFEIDKRTPRGRILQMQPLSRSSYIEKMQRSIAEKDCFVGRIIMSKHAPELCRKSVV